MTEVFVPVGRWSRWLANFEASHGQASYAVSEGTLQGLALDGSTFTARPPLGATVTGDPDPDALAVEVTGEWGIVVARKGGFAIARVDGTRPVARKVGRRHVQGRTKAGGQSQQRFARRRDNQAKAAYDAAADHAVRILGAHASLRLVTGGDRQALDAVLSDPRLAKLQLVAHLPHIPEPRAAELDRAIAEALSVRVHVVNAGD